MTAMHPMLALFRRNEWANQRLLDFCAQHDIVCDIELIPIQKIDEAYERLRRGDVKYRFVIDLASLKA